MSGLGTVRTRLTALLSAPRPTAYLVALAAMLGAAYVLVTFDRSFLAGRGAFWAYPRGPWLFDTADARDNIDVLDYLVAYTGLVRSPWTLPLFYVPLIGVPAGTNVVFLDVIPVAALLGRIATALTGTFLLPYGAWVAACFVLSAVCTALFLVENRLHSVFAATAGAMFAVSTPVLLHRFGHFPLMAQFLVVGGLYLYLRDQRPSGAGSPFLRWAGWLVLCLFTNAYLFGMASAIYAASLLRSWRVSRLRLRRLEPVLIAAAVLATLFVLGFVGSGSVLSGSGFGLYSMNLLSPFLPQRSGVFPSMQAIVDATTGQYEGFAYLGMGGVLLIALALLSRPRTIGRAVLRHPELSVVLLLLTAFALSNHVYFGQYDLGQFNIGWRLGKLVNIFRSSGRMFWPAYYALLLGSLVVVLRTWPARWHVPVISLLCLLQLVDTEPLRARMTWLTTHPRSPVLNEASWSGRIVQSRSVHIYPTFWCSSDAQRVADLELQLYAIRANRGVNSVYNPRLTTDCDAETRALTSGPWDPDTLYVLLSGAAGLPPDWTPPGLACQAFSEGRWCLGRRSGPPAS